jgi:glycosyltransferase involved in cell wall biosynthesis
MKLVIQNTSRVWGGNEKWLANLAAGLIGRGHEVVVSCRPGIVSQELLERGIRTSSFRPRGPIDFVSGLAFAAWLGRHRPDTLLLTSWRVTPWAVFAARLARVPRVVMRLGLVREFPRRSPKAVALQGVDAVIVNSVEIRDTWRQSAPATLSDRVHVVLNAVMSRSDERRALRTQLRDELGLKAETVLIGGAGHVAKRKGFDVLLRSFGSMKEPDVALAIAGDGEHRSALEEEATALGLSSRVFWLGHRNDGAGIIAGLDLFVLSSHNEGMANVMLEAMAGGCPVIAFDVSGVRKALGEGEGRPPAGWTVPAGDEEALASAMDEVTRVIRSGSPVVAERTREAHWRAVNWFSLDRMVEECERIIFRG